MINEMMCLLKAEQDRDDCKNAYCIKSFDEISAQKIVAATALTSQPTGEEVRTCHGCQHRDSQLHSSRLSNPRDTTRHDATHQHDNATTACTELALWWLITLNESSLQWVPAGHPRYKGAVTTGGRGWLDCTARAHNKRMPSTLVSARGGGAMVGVHHRSRQDQGPTEFFHQDRWHADEIRQRVDRLQVKRCRRQAGPGVEGKVENPVQLDKAAHDKMWKETPKVERIIPRVNLTIPKVMLIIQQLRRTCRV